MSRRKQAKPRSLKRGEWDENSPNIEMGLQDSSDDISRLEKVSDVAGEDGGSCVVGEEVDSHESNPVYRCESCGLRLESLKRFMDHRNFDCVAGVEDTLIVDATHGEPEEARVTMETENSLESDATTRDPTSWQSDTPDDQSLSPSSCPTPTDPDVDLNYTIGTTESTPYACQFCDKAFPRLSYLKRHEQSHGDQMPFKCDFCHRLFKHKRSRDRHVKLHTGDKKYRCPHCDSAFSRSDHLKIHMKTHDNAKPFQCTICNRGYNTPAALTSHMQNHKKDAFGPLNFRCMQCTAIFQTSHQLQDHISTHSSDSASPVLDKGIQCPLCPHLVTKQESLSAHVEQMHSGETIKCHLCSESFSSLESFYQHMKMHNDAGNSEMEISKSGNAARLTCMYCTKDSFTSLESLQLHVQAMHNSLVNGELPTSSTALNGSPSTSPGLSTTHPPSVSTPMRNLSPSSSTALQGQLNCEYCTMKFSSIQALQKHTLSVHSFTDVLSSCPDFVCCAHCTMAFGNSTALSEHIQFVHEFSSAPNRNTSSPRTSAASSTSKDLPVSAPSKSAKSSKSHRSHMSATRASSPSSSTTNSGVSNTNSISSNIKLNTSNGECHHFTHPGTLLCNQCNAAFPDFEAFRTHLKTHLDEVVQKYICSECQGEFTSEEQLDGHVIGHYLSTTTEYGCQSCLKLFSKPDELQKHLMDIHAHHLYRCSLCKEVFDSKVSVQVHFAVKHSNECKLFKCTSCSSVFRSEMEFQLHVKVAHLRKAQPFRCLFCNFSYSSELELQCHLTTHKKQFACTLCDEAFHVEFLLDRHMQSKHATQTSSVPADGNLTSATPTPSSSGDVTSSMSPSSTIAATGTNTSSNNNNNNNNSSSSSSKGKTKAARSPNASSSSVASTNPTTISLPKKELKCDICDAEFLSEVSLNGHRRQAHNIRVSGSQKSTQQILSLYCAYCNEACKSRTELENHMKVHTVSCGKHKCNICDEVCPTATTLAEHKLTHCKVVSGSMCVTCKVNLKSEDQYYSHLQQHNSQGLPLPCVVCRQTLMSEIEVQMHVKFHLKNAEPLFPCCICLKQFEAMNLIRNGPTNGAQSYICKECFHHNTSSGVSPLSDEVIRCSDCKVKFESILELDKHRAVHKKTYQCIKCQMSFDTESEIQLHVASHMLNEGTSHECQLCHQVFDSPAKLQCHLIEHTFEGCGSYSCYMCSAVFTTACLLQQHMLEHGLNSRPYDCSRCHQRFFFRAEFENHLFTHGSDPLHVADGACSTDISDPSSTIGLESKTSSSSSSSSSTVPSTVAMLDELQCSDCLRTFASVVNLTNHRKIHQQKSTSYKCSLCPEMFASSVDMQQHYFKAHNDAELNRTKKTYCCTECGKEFPCLSNLQGHLRIHTQGTKYVCPECNKEFALARNLGIHMRSHSGEKPYECPICKKRFARKENRKAHLKSHSGVKPFMCPHCGKTFSRKCHVKEHMRIHVSTPKACEICLETVTSVGALHKHMIEVHNKEIHNECKICSEVFDHPRKLKRHLKRVHDIVQDPVTEDPDLGSETSPTSLSSESGDTNDFDNSECSSLLESEGSRAATPMSVEKKETNAPLEDMDCE